MTIEEVSKQCGIQAEELKQYEEKGFLRYKKRKNNVSDYQSADIQQIELIHFLLGIGMEDKVLVNFLKLPDRGEEHKQERMRILRKCRFQLLDEIHGKQQSLDRLDYLIHEIKKNK